MVKVYFESTVDGINADGRYAELVAMFKDEETYDVCINVLEEKARLADMVLTESIEDEDIDSLFISVNDVVSEEKDCSWCKHNMAIARCKKCVNYNLYEKK